MSPRCALVLLISALAFANLRGADVNVLLIIADDLGVDAAPGYSPGTNKPPMPNLALLQSKGVTFRNVWANPLCSPTRATLLTGRYGFRTGVQYVSLDRNAIGVRIGEPSIPRALMAKRGIPSGAFGKWHVAQLGENPATPPVNHPIVMGFAKYAGNLSSTLASYGTWTKVVNDPGLTAVTTTSKTYATSDAVDEALDWIRQQGPSPWFAWVAFNAPHDPFHKPPAPLHHYDDLPANGGPPRGYYEAMCEALDTELGRLVNGLPAAVKAKTMIIFIGDNGTPGEVKRGGFRGAKFDVYEGVSACR